MENVSNPLVVCQQTSYQQHPIKKAKEKMVMTKNSTYIINNYWMRFL